jgi:hypothetical protein
MTWSKEPFAFEEGEQPPGDRITVPIDLGEVIREGMRRNQDSNDLFLLLPNLDFRLKFPSVAPTDKLKQTKLTREEWQVLGYVTGQNSIRQIAKVLTGGLRQTGQRAIAATQHEPFPIAAQSSTASTRSD